MELIIRIFIGALAYGGFLVLYRVVSRYNHKVNQNKARRNTTTTNNDLRINERNGLNLTDRHN